MTDVGGTSTAGLRDDVTAVVTTPPANTEAPGGVVAVNAGASIPQYREDELPEGYALDGLNQAVLLNPGEALVVDETRDADDSLPSGPDPDQWGAEARAARGAVVNPATLNVPVEITDPESANATPAPTPADQ